MTAAVIANLPVGASAPTSPVVPDRTATRPLIPATMDECVRYAQIIARSGLAPKSFYDDGKDPVACCFIAIQLGAEVGLSPMTAVQHVAVVNGRPSLYGPAQLAVVEASGLLEDFEEGLEGDKPGESMVAWCRVKRRGRHAKTTRFSWAQASKAGLTTKKGPWQDYPERMMQARARAFALRDAFPDVLMGLSYTPDELLDITPEPRPDPKPDPKPDFKAKAPPEPKPPLQVLLPGDEATKPAEFPRSGPGLKEALAFMASAVLDGFPAVVLLNAALLDTIADKMPQLAEEVAELRKAAAAALTPPDEPEPEPEPEPGAADAADAADADDRAEARVRDKPEVPRDDFGLPPPTDAEGLPY